MVKRRKITELPVVCDKERAGQWDGQLQCGPVPDEVGDDREEGGADPERELSQNTEPRTELGTANLSHLVFLGGEN